MKNPSLYSLDYYIYLIRGGNSIFIFLENQPFPDIIDK